MGIICAFSTAKRALHEGVSMSKHDAQFALLGLYMVHWSSFELAVDIATVKIKRTTPDDVVRTTGGWTVYKKVRYLYDIVKESSHKDKDLILNMLCKIPAESIRNIIAHSYMRFGDNEIIFIQRKSTTKVNVVRFTTSELQFKLGEMSSLADAVAEIFGNTEADAEAFITAAQTS
jgi:hypothetical protein